MIVDSYDNVWLWIHILVTSYVFRQSVWSNLWIHAVSRNPQFGFHRDKWIEHTWTAQSWGKACFLDPLGPAGFMTSLNATAVIRGLNLMKHLDCHLRLIQLGVSSNNRGTPSHHPAIRLVFSLTKTIQPLGHPLCRKPPIDLQEGVSVGEPSWFIHIYGLWSKWWRHLVSFA